MKKYQQNIHLLFQNNKFILYFQISFQDFHLYFGSNSEYLSLYSSVWSINFYRLNQSYVYQHISERSLKTVIFYCIWRKDRIKKYTLEGGWVVKSGSNWNIRLYISRTLAKGGGVCTFGEGLSQRQPLYATMHSGIIYNFLEWLHCSRHKSLAKVIIFKEVDAVFRALSSAPGNSRRQRA